AGVLRRPVAPPPPLRQHRLLAAARGADDVGLVRDARARGARDPVRAVPGERSVAPVGDRRCRPARVRRAGLLDLHRVLARDRQACEPTHSPPRGRTGARADDRVTALPQGTVTFVFTDIEGSTALLKRLGDRYGDALADHRRLIRAEFGARG